MNIKKLVFKIGTVFVVALVTVAMVTFLWNIIVRGASAIDWETSFRFAIIFGILLTWVKSRESKVKPGTNPLAPTSASVHLWTANRRAPVDLPRVEPPKEVLDNSKYS